MQKFCCEKTLGLKGKVHKKKCAASFCGSLSVPSPKSKELDALCLVSLLVKIKCIVILKS